MRLINQHNEKFEKGAESWNMKINQFGDLTKAEFRKVYLGKPTLNTKFKSTVLESTVTPPESIDWKKMGVVSAVQDQGKCNSGYAFGFVSLIF